ncbi:unnamed protein product [Meganyctiphanes norvegica]|uniref:Protein sleepless n=1 Tax=Meganyctiphanes norvegica TaxID=48144 RepID=A0AAV2SIU7_MEGNR
MKSTFVSLMLLGLVSTGLCLKCYVGTGDVGSDTTKEEDGFKSCSVGKAEMGGVSVVVRDGVETETPIGCTELMGTKVCFCNSNLCNTAPATAQAIMPVIIMALLTKFII